MKYFLKTESFKFILKTGTDELFLVSDGSAFQSVGTCRGCHEERSCAVSFQIKRWIGIKRRFFDDERIADEMECMVLVNRECTNVPDCLEPCM